MVNNNKNEWGYAVFRSGTRVSEQVYHNEDDAKEELCHWEKILNRWPDGTKVIVKKLRD